MGKRLLAALCTAILLMTSPSVSVLADESISDEYVSEQVEEITDVSKQGEDAPNIVESQEDPLDISEPKEVMEEISVPEEGAEEIEVEDTSLADDAETEIPEEAVGEGEEQVFTVGDGVTAKLVKEGDKTVLYFDSKGGTLWHDWRSKLGDYAGTVKLIRFTTDTTVMYLPEDSSYLFNENYMYHDNDLYALSEIEQIELDKVDTSKVKNMRGMFFGCNSLTNLDLSSFNTSNLTNMGYMFCWCTSLANLDLSGFDTSKVRYMNNMFEECSVLTNLDLSSFNTTNVPAYMDGMFSGCSSLTNLNLSSLDTTNVTSMESMFSGCSSLTNLDLSSFNTTNVTSMGYMFSGCSSLTELDLSSFDTSGNVDMEDMFVNCSSLQVLKTPKMNANNPDLPFVMYDSQGKDYIKLPTLSQSIILTAAMVKKDISKASVAGVSLSYGYSGKAYTPTVTVKVDGVTLTKDTDYTVKYENNMNPGTAKITVTGKGKYTGTKTKTFEIVDCVSSVVSGKTYLLIPKNNSKTAVCAVGGKMVNNTKVYITDRGNSESQKFKAVKNSDGTWKFINSKCELALAVQQNSSELGAGIVLYDQTTKPAQNWKLSKKADNSFAIINSVTGYSIAMSDKSAIKGTTLSMAETASVGLQRFYLVETSAVSAPFDGTKSIRAAKNKNFSVNIASASKAEGANVSLYTYTNSNARKFKIIYSGGGYYRLVNVNSGLCLTIKDNSNADGANIIQSKWKGYSSQRWKITTNSDGTVTITNMLGTVLHLLGNRTVNNTNIHARKAASTTAQKWYLQ